MKVSNLSAAVASATFPEILAALFVKINEHVNEGDSGFNPSSVVAHMNSHIEEALNLAEEHVRETSADNAKLAMAVKSALTNTTSVEGNKVKYPAFSTLVKSASFLFAKDNECDIILAEKQVDSFIREKLTGYIEIAKGRGGLQVANFDDLIERLDSFKLEYYCLT